MSGQAGGRGYLFQSLICVLDILSDDENWAEVSVHPDSGLEKVDILLRFDNGTSKVIQVKSSQNQINKPDAESWARELRKNVQADDYELRLIGPCSESVTAIKEFERVRIPPPHSLNITAFIQQSAQRLDAYLDRKGTMRVPPFVRELLDELAFYARDRGTEGERQ
jgi:hypothetical protein